MHLGLGRHGQAANAWFPPSRILNPRWSTSGSSGTHLSYHYLTVLSSSGSGSTLCCTFLHLTATSPGQNDWHSGFPVHHSGYSREVAEGPGTWRCEFKSSFCPITAVLPWASYLTLTVWDTSSVKWGRQQYLPYKTTVKSELTCKITQGPADRTCSIHYFI